MLLQEIGKSITENFTEPTSDSFRNKNKIYLIIYGTEYISDKNTMFIYKNCIKNTKTHCWEIQQENKLNKSNQQFLYLIGLQKQVTMNKYLII